MAEQRASRPQSSQPDSSSARSRSAQHPVQHPKGDGPEHLSPTSGLVRFANDGSYVVQLVAADRPTLLRLDVEAARRYEITVVADTAWQAASLEIHRYGRWPFVGMTVKTASSRDDGAIEARSSDVSPGGRRVECRLTVDPTGRWRSTYADQRRTGMRITGEASGALAGDGVTRMTRRRLDPDGTGAWSLEAETRQSTVRAASRDRQGPPVRTAMVTTSHLSRAQGGTGSYRLVSYEERAGPNKYGQGGWHPVGSAPGSHASQWGTVNPDGSKSVTTITHFDGGGFSSHTKTTFGPNVPTGSSGSFGGTTKGEEWTTTVDGHGKKTTIHETWQVDQDKSGNDVTTWEKTTVGPDGKVTTERGVTVFNGPGAAESTTTSTVHPDGSVTITTTTVDPMGNGTRHTTTTDKDGNTTSDKTENVGAGNPPPPPPPPSDDDDSGSGDDGMEWDGADEGPPNVMPSRPATIWDVLADPRFGLDDESDDPVGDRIAAGLRHGVLVIPGPVGDTGWGEATGSESLPELHLTPGSALFVGRVPVPTDDWGDWNDPRVHIAYAARLLDALAHSGAVDLRAVTRAARTTESIGGLIARAGATRSG